ncbi:hypothetical protein HU200_019357 [Digitaria exilis]|uniref:Uncharacterized protein n=1 Tax=Digitaria exilis TaxID=1010633 RepID=A0A835F394_9POAL|nr:hypothetical protein HU200_019357 [Digitaria exilis]
MDTPPSVPASANQSIPLFFGGSGSATPPPGAPTSLAPSPPAARLGCRSTGRRHVVAVYVSPCHSPTTHGGSPCRPPAEGSRKGRDELRKCAPDYALHVYAQRLLPPVNPPLARIHVGRRVHKISVLDICLANAERYVGYILVCRDDKGRGVLDDAHRPWIPKSVSPV